MKNILILTFFIVLVSMIQSGWAKNPSPAVGKAQVDLVKTLLLTKFEKEFKDKKAIGLLQKEVLGHKGKAVPALIEVMKNSKFSDKNRWIATFLLGRIMGVKASTFIAKFAEHPNWVLRLASLKVLLALRQKNYANIYNRALKDESLIVRSQALANIRHFEIKEMAPQVWSMLYDKRNYYNPKDGQAKRTNIIKDIILTIGELKFSKARDPLLKMVQKEKYSDIFEEIDYSLEKITGKDSPKGDKKVKQHYWSRFSMAQVTI